MARQQIQISLAPEVVEALDEMRDSEPRSAWIAYLIRRFKTEQDPVLAKMGTLTVEQVAVLGTLLDFVAKSDIAIADGQQRLADYLNSQTEETS